MSWFDSEKIKSRYGYPPFTVDETPSTCELYAQGCDPERKARLKATKMFEADIAKCGDDWEAIAGVAKGVDFYTYKAARKLAGVTL